LKRVFLTLTQFSFRLYNARIELNLWSQDARVSSIPVGVAKAKKALLADANFLMSNGTEARPVSSRGLRRCAQAFLAGALAVAVGDLMVLAAGGAGLPGVTLGRAFSLLGALSAVFGFLLAAMALSENKPTRRRNRDLSLFGWFLSASFAGGAIHQAILAWSEWRHGYPTVGVMSAAVYAGGSLVLAVATGFGARAANIKSLGNPESARSRQGRIGRAGLLFAGGAAALAVANVLEQRFLAGHLGAESFKVSAFAGAGASALLSASAGMASWALLRSRTAIDRRRGLAKASAILAASFFVAAIGFGLEASGAVNSGFPEAAATGLWVTAAGQVAYAGGAVGAMIVLKRSVQQN